MATCTSFSIPFTSNAKIFRIPCLGRRARNAQQDAVRANRLIEPKNCAGLQEWKRQLDRPLVAHTAGDWGDRGSQDRRYDLLQPLGNSRRTRHYP